MRLIASVFNCFHTLCRHSLSRSLLIWPVLLLAPQYRVEHPSADRTELGGGGGIRNHDEQHVSVFDSLCVQHIVPTFTLQGVADLVCAVVGSSVKS